MQDRRQSKTRQHRILCADDNVLLGEIMVRLLTRHGHLAEHVANGVEAAERMLKNLGHFDVLVTDQQMPGRNGLELVELLRRVGYAGRIVVYSSSITDELAHRYNGLGVDAIVTKSSRADELLAAIDGEFWAENHAHASHRR